MDQYLSTVIIALITGIFSIITLLIQSKQEKVVNKINAQATFLEKEKILKQGLHNKESEQDKLMDEIMLLILDTNLSILHNTTTEDQSLEVINDRYNELKARFNEITEDIQKINKEYEMLLDISKELNIEELINHNQQ